MLDGLVKWSARTYTYITSWRGLGASRRFEIVVSWTSELTAKGLSSTVKMATHIDKTSQRKGNSSHSVA